MVDRGCLDMNNMNNDVSFVDSRVFSQAGKDQRRRELPADYFPQNNDVICSRGADSYNHIGNKKFRSIVDYQLGNYTKASSKLEKSLIVSSIIDEVRHNGGVFLRRDARTDSYYEVDEKLSREKAGQAIRAQIRKMKTSSIKQEKKAKAVKIVFDMDQYRIEDSISTIEGEEAFAPMPMTKTLQGEWTVVSVDSMISKEITFPPPPPPILRHTSSQWTVNSSTTPTSSEREWTTVSFDPLPISNYGNNNGDDMDVPSPPPMLRQTSSMWSEALGRIADDVSDNLSDPMRRYSTLSLMFDLDSDSSLASCS